MVATTKPFVGEFFIVMRTHGSAWFFQQRMPLYSKFSLAFSLPLCKGTYHLRRARTIRRDKGSKSVLENHDYDIFYITNHPIILHNYIKIETCIHKRYTNTSAKRQEILKMGHTIIESRNTKFPGTPLFINIVIQ